MRVHEIQDIFSTGQSKAEVRSFNVRAHSALLRDYSPSYGRSNPGEKPRSKLVGDDFGRVRLFLRKS